MLHLCSRPKNGGQLIILSIVLWHLFTRSGVIFYFLFFFFQQRFARFFAESGFYCENGNSFATRSDLFMIVRQGRSSMRDFHSRLYVCVCVCVFQSYPPFLRLDQQRISISSWFFVERLAIITVRMREFFFLSFYLFFPCISRSMGK